MRTKVQTFFEPTKDDIYSECPPDRFPMPAQRRLSHKTDIVYGDIPRRVSANYALAVVAGTPMMSSLTMSAPWPEYYTDEFEDEYEVLRHYPEPEETLYVGAWRIGEHTWISSPERALLDTAHLGNHNRVPEWILRSMVCNDFSFEELVHISEEADMGEALRKIASISVLLNWYKKKHKPLWIKKLRKYAKSIPSEPTYVCRSFAEAGLTKGWHDRNFNVIWNVSREETYNELLIH